MTMLPKRSMLRRHPGRDDGGRVVLVDDRRALEPVAGPQRRPVVEARRHLLELAADAEPRLALVAKRVLRRAPPGPASGISSGGISPIPRTRTFGISMSDSSNRREYSRSWMSSKSARTFSTHASSIAPEATSTRSS